MKENKSNFGHVRRMNSEKKPDLGLWVFMGCFFSRVECWWLGSVWKVTPLPNLGEEVWMPSSVVSVGVLFTWSPTLIFFVRAPSGNIACTWGTTVELTIPPSGPITWTSCRIRVIMAKYWGKSVVKIRVMRSVLRSSLAVSSKKKKIYIFINFWCYYRCSYSIYIILHPILS